MKRSIIVAALLAVSSFSIQSTGAQDVSEPEGTIREEPGSSSESNSSAEVLAPTLPTGFYTEEIAPGETFSTPVAVTFSPDGRIFVVEKSGRVFIVQNGVRLSTPFIDLQSEVLNHWDRGLLGFALDPAFDTNGFVYLLYTYDRDGTGDYQRQDVAARVTRYTVDASDPNQVDLSTRLVLIGNTFAEAIPSCYYSHTIGTLQFGTDGTLLIGSGDGGDFTQIDPGGLHPDCFATGLFGANEDVGAFRSQYIESLAGKILRIDPATGNGLPSNPFYTGDVTDNQSRVWALGLRNPYRYTLRKNGSANPTDGNPGALFIGDVGWGTWEDLNVSETGGENFGWPCYEGPNQHAGYQAQTPAHDDCSTVPGQVAPTYYWSHSNEALSSPPGLRANAIVVGDINHGTRYPTAYKDRIFYADYTRGWISTSAVDVSNNLSDHQPFGSDLGAVVDIRLDPWTGYVYWVNVGTGKVLRLRHNAENAPPNAVATATPNAGASPLVVSFTGSTSSDPNGGPLTFHWDFGNGDTSSAADTTYTYNTSGIYQVSLTVTDDHGSQNMAFLQVAVDNTYPIASIVSPLNAQAFDISDFVTLSGSATDAEDPPGSLTYEWIVSQTHNTHGHPDFYTATGQNAGFSVAEHGVPEEVSFLEVRLVVTDTGGLTDTTTHFIEIRRPGENDITADGTPDALVTSPTGSGNPNLLTIADGVFPPEGASDPLLQYDTFDGTSKSVDWIGYTYPADRYFSKLVFKEGIVSPAGGWFDSLSVEVRHGGVWESVQYLNLLGLYEGNNGTNFSQYTLLFEAKWGDAIRVIGRPGGTSEYVSVAELRVFELPTAEFTATATSGVGPLTVNFTDQSSVDGSGNRSWDFGDGNTGYGTSPQHTYAHPGAYDVNLSVTSPTGVLSENKPDFVVIAANGLLGDYYDDETFTGARLIRTDATVDFGWGSGSPDPSMGADEFSTRWTGWVVPEHTETYSFHTETDDGVRLWIGGQLIIDQWILQGPTVWTGSLPLEAGKYYAVKMEYYEHQGGAVARLRWSSPSVPLEVIPSSRLLAAEMGPRITRFEPQYGEYLTRVTVHGQNFANLSSVAVNGMPASSFSVLSDRALWLDIPEGSSSGPITVTTPDGMYSTPGTLYVGDAVLPVDHVVGFSAIAKPGSVRLNWTVVSQDDVRGFAIEQKNPETEFVEVGFVDAVTQRDSYTFEVDVSSVGTQSYRLRTVTTSGAIRYSETTDILVKMLGTHVVEAPYPNPFSQRVAVRFAVAESQRVTATLYDMLGRRLSVLLDEVVVANETREVVLTDVAALTSGVYFVRLEGEHFVEDREVVHVK